MAFKQIATTGTIWEGKILSMAKHTESYCIAESGFFFFQCVVWGEILTIDDL